MNYELQKFEKEMVTIEGHPREVFVAVIKKLNSDDPAETPYRIVIENLDSQEAALHEVHCWIKQREEEDQAAIENKAANEEQARKDQMLDSLNAGIGK